jgi:hypothetical protein
MRPETLLALLRDSSDGYRAFVAPDLRRFACWCARDAGAEADVIAHRVVYAAEKAAAGTLTAQSLARERQAASGAAAGAGTIGLPRRIPGAALQFAAFSTAEADPLEAARLAAHYAALSVEWRDGAPAAVAMRMRQTSALRYFVCNPFIAGAWRQYCVA